jgi:hypothetical protein
MNQWRMILIVLCFIGAQGRADDDGLSTLPSARGNKDWVLVKDDRLHQIKIEVKQEDDKKFRSMRVSAVMDASLETVARVQFDADNLKRWFWSTSESRLLKKVSDREFYYYQVFNAPLMPERDSVVHAVVEPYTAKKGFMVLKMSAAPDYIPPKPGLVRMVSQDLVFKFTPIEKDKTLIIFEGYINPGGFSPAWATNFIQRKSPYASLLGMQRMVQMPEYRDAKGPLPFTYKED